jgi:hypothetical protein
VLLDLWFSVLCFVERCFSFVLFPLAIVLFVPLWITAFGYPFDIFKLFLVKRHYHLYSGKWNYRIRLASFRFSWEAHVWSLPHMNKGTHQ